MSWRLFPSTEFGHYKKQWQLLNDESVASPLLEPDFVQPLLSAFSTGGEFLACYEQKEEIVAMALVTQRRSGLWETFQPSQAPVSLWLNRDGLDVPTLLSELIRKLPGLPLTLGLTQRDPDLAPRPADNPHLRTLDYVHTARISVEGSFETYWEARGKNLRNNLKKQRSRLAKDGVTTRLTVSRERHHIASAIINYGNLESAGWKAQGGTAIHPDNPQGQFYRTMLEAFCQRGAACVYRYWFNDQLVAMDLCIEGNESIIFLKTTYDERISPTLSPALLMREETFRLLFDEGKFKKIEFYGKAMEWQLRWTDELRPMYHVTEYRWPFLIGLRQLKQHPLNLLRQLRAKLNVAPR